MQIVANTRLIQRSRRLGNILLFGGMGIMVAVLAFSFYRPAQNLIFAAFALGALLISQLGLSLLSRYGRQPRMDEVLSESLKGLDQRYWLFHYYLGADHVVIGPPGVLVLVPRLEDGRISYDGQAWWQSRPKSGLLRRPSRKKLRGLEQDAQAEVSALRKTLERSGLTPDSLTIQPFVVFLNPKAMVDATSAPLPNSFVKKLKNSIRHLPRGNSPEQAALAALAQT
jgi:hypothetical protein